MHDFRSVTPEIPPVEDGGATTRFRAASYALTTAALAENDRMLEILIGIADRNNDIAHENNAARALVALETVQAGLNVLMANPQFPANVAPQGTRLFEVGSLSCHKALGYFEANGVAQDDFERPQAYFGETLQLALLLREHAHPQADELAQRALTLCDRHGLEHIVPKYKPERRGPASDVLAPTALTAG